MHPGAEGFEECCSWTSGWSNQTCRLVRVRACVCVCVCVRGWVEDTPAMPRLTPLDGHLSPSPTVDEPDGVQVGRAHAGGFREETESEGSAREPAPARVHKRARAARPRAAGPGQQSPPARGLAGSRGPGPFPLPLPSPGPARPGPAPPLARYATSRDARGAGPRRARGGAAPRGRRAIGRARRPRPRASPRPT